MKRERNEYPRPQFRREEWLPLNGEWEFAFDDDNEGIKRGYYKGERALDKKIQVPFSYQYEASGIEEKENHEVVWYRRFFEISKSGKRALLCFNGCDYIADAWVNGIHVVSHTGAFAALFRRCDGLPERREKCNRGEVL